MTTGATYDRLIWGAIDLTAGDFSLGDGTEVGAAQAVTDVIRSLYMDGSLVVGQFDDNRTVKLVVTVANPDRLTLAASVEALLGEAHKSANTLRWVPAGTGLECVADTFKAQPSEPEVYPAARTFEFEVPALPFWRSVTRESTTAVAASVKLADFGHGPEYTYHTPSDQSGVYSDPVTVPCLTVGAVFGPATVPVPIDGTGCMQVLADYWRNGYASASVMAMVGPVSGTWDLTGCTSIACGYYQTDGYSKTIAVRLTSPGASETFESSGMTPALGWNYQSVDISHPASVDLAHITSWTLWVTNYQGNMFAQETYYLGMLRAYPAASGVASTPRGAVYKVANVKGSARTAAQIAIDRGGTNALSSVLVARAPSGTPSTTPILEALTGGAVTTTAPSTFKGTYRLVFAANAAIGAASATVKQYVGAGQVGATFTTPVGSVVDGASHYIDCGLVTLPLVDMPGDVTNVTYQIAYGNTTPTEVILLDTRGFLAWVQTVAGTVDYVWVDEPQPGIQTGPVYGGTHSDRTDAVSLTAAAQLEGGATLDPGDNLLLVYCPDGAPSTVRISYYPRFLMERST